MATIPLFADGASEATLEEDILLLEEKLKQFAKEEASKYRKSIEYAETLLERKDLPPLGAVDAAIDKVKALIEALEATATSSLPAESPDTDPPPALILGADPELLTNARRALEKLTAKRSECEANEPTRLAHQLVEQSFQLKIATASALQVLLPTALQKELASLPTPIKTMLETIKKFFDQELSEVKDDGVALYRHTSFAQIKQAGQPVLDALACLLKLYKHLEHLKESPRQLPNNFINLARWLQLTLTWARLCDSHKVAVEALNLTATIENYTKVSAALQALEQCLYEIEPYASVLKQLQTRVSKEQQRTASPEPSSLLSEINALTEKLATARKNASSFHNKFSELIFDLNLRLKKIRAALQLHDLVDLRQKVRAICQEILSAVETAKKFDPEGKGFSNITAPKFIGEQVVFLNTKLEEGKEYIAEHQELVKALITDPTKQAILLPPKGEPILIPAAAANITPGS